VAIGEIEELVMKIVNEIIEGWSCSVQICVEINVR
jgi:hypothetical protein